MGTTVGRLSTPLFAIVHLSTRMCQPERWCFSWASLPVHVSQARYILNVVVKHPYLR